MLLGMVSYEMEKTYMRSAWYVVFILLFILFDIATTNLFAHNTNKNIDKKHSNGEILLALSGISWWGSTADDIAGTKISGHFDSLAVNFAENINHIGNNNSKAVKKKMTNTKKSSSDPEKNSPLGLNIFDSIKSSFSSKALGILHLDANKVSLNWETGNGLLTGNVSLKYSNGSLRSENLEFSLDAEKKFLIKISASKKVEWVDSTFSGSADVFTWDLKKEYIILKGDAKIKYESRLIKGTEIIVHLSSKSIECTLCNIEIK